MENKFKVGVKKKKEGSVRSLFSKLERAIKLENYFDEGFPVKYLPKIMFVLMLGLLYIGNTHYTEKTVRKINSLQIEVEDLRADYTTLKSDLMFASKQSEVARKVSASGLKESVTPPFKITVKEGEY